MAVFITDTQSLRERLRSVKLNQAENIQFVEMDYVECNRMRDEASLSHLFEFQICRFHSNLQS